MGSLLNRLYDPFIVFKVDRISMSQVLGCSLKMMISYPTKIELKEDDMKTATDASKSHVIRHTAKATVFERFQRLIRA